MTKLSTSLIRAVSRGSGTDDDCASDMARIIKAASSCVIKFPGRSSPYSHTPASCGGTEVSSLAIAVLRIYFYC